MRYFYTRVANHNFYPTYRSDNITFKPEDLALFQHKPPVATKHTHSSHPVQSTTNIPILPSKHSKETKIYIPKHLLLQFFKYSPANNPTLQTLSPQHTQPHTAHTHTHTNYTVIPGACSYVFHATSSTHTHTHSTQTTTHQHNTHPNPNNTITPHPDILIPSQTPIPHHPPLIPHPTNPSASIQTHFHPVPTPFSPFPHTSC